MQYVWNFIVITNLDLDILKQLHAFAALFFPTKLNQYMFLGVTEQWFSHENRIMNSWRRRWRRGLWWRRRKGTSSTAQSSNAAGNFYVQPWLKHLLLGSSACWLELRHSIVVNFMELPCNILYPNAIFLNKIPDIGTVSLSLYEHYVMEIVVLELLCVISSRTFVHENKGCTVLLLLYTPTHTRSCVSIVLICLFASSPAPHCFPLMLNLHLLEKKMH